MCCKNTNSAGTRTGSGRTLSPTHTRGVMLSSKNTLWQYPVSRAFRHYWLKHILHGANVGQYMLVKRHLKHNLTPNVMNKQVSYLKLVVIVTTKMVITIGLFLALYTQLKIYPI